MISHPFQNIRLCYAVKLFRVLLVLTLVLSVALWVSSATLKPGIIEFEFFPLETIQIWNNSDQVRAAFNTGLDFLYLLVYSNTIASACIWASRRLRAPWSDVGIWLAWGQWLAAGFDVVENIALVSILFGSRSIVFAQIARGSAGLKFAAIVLGLFYVGVTAIFHRPRRLAE